MDRVVSMRDGKIVADDLRSERTDALEDRFGKLVRTAS